MHVGNVLEKFGMQDAKSMVTPVDASTKLVVATDDDVYRISLIRTHAFY